VGHALELVETDVLARHRRQRGDEVRFQTGTDDNALKNVQGAETEGIASQEYVERVAGRFLALPDGRCPEHDTVPDLVEENNWFFRPSHYQDQLHDLIVSIPYV